MKRPDGTELLAAPAEEIFFRAPTCNDKMLDMDNSFAGDWPPLYHPERKLVEFKWEQTPGAGHYHVYVTTRIADRIDSRVKWTISSSQNRFLDYHQEMHFKYEDLHSVARVGMIFPLVEGFENVKYFGRGPYENYPDRTRASLVGRWETTVSDMLENYLVPSECGGRGNVFSLELSGNGDASKKLRIVWGTGLQFSALHVSPWDLMAVDHSWELKPSKKTWLIVDGAHMGVGGDDGWSVNVHDEYVLRPRPSGYSLDFSLDFLGTEDKTE